MLLDCCDLKEAIAQTQPAGEIEVVIPRALDLSSRTATVTIRSASLDWSLD